MKRIEIYDTDREVLSRISKATGQDIPTLIGNLLKIGSQVYAHQILAADAPSTGDPVAPRQAKRRTQKQNKETPNADLILAMPLAKSQGTISISAIQRGLGYSYNHAAHLFDLMRDKGLLEPGTTKSAWKWKE